MLLSLSYLQLQAVVAGYFVWVSNVLQACWLRDVNRVQMSLGTQNCVLLVPPQLVLLQYIKAGEYWNIEHLESCCCSTPLSWWGWVDFSPPPPYLPIPLLSCCLLGLLGFFSDVQLLSVVGSGGFSSLFKLVTLWQYSCICWIHQRFLLGILKFFPWEGVVWIETLKNGPTCWGNLPGFRMKVLNFLIFLQMTP